MVVGESQSDLCNEAFRIAKCALASEGHDRRQKMIADARSEPSIAIDEGKLDADPYALNCLNGTINLRNGALRPIGAMTFAAICSGVTLVEVDHPDEEGSSQPSPVNRRCAAR